MKFKSLKKDAKAVLNKGYVKMDTYQIQENLLQTLLKNYPNHKNKSAVETKVKLLNLFYSTGIQATNMMASNILSIKNIDELLKEGDFGLVAKIANLRINNNTTRYNYSFATKYCAYHEPKKFPIYDSIVAMTFISFFEKGLLPKYKYSRRKVSESNVFTKNEFAEKLKDYEFFVEIYQYFMKLYDLEDFTYREIDAYIWGAFKLAGSDYEIEKMPQLDKSKIVEYVI